MFENTGLQPFDIFYIERILAIIIGERTIELTQMFSKEVIQREFPYLYQKLVREGREPR